MKNNDWRNVFGQASEGFLNRIDRTLDALEEACSPRRHVHPSMALIAAAIIAVFAGTALAAGPGLIEKFNNFRWFTVPPEAEQLVESDLGGAETDLFTLDVEQALYDGQSALVQLLITPTDGSAHELLYAETSEAYDVYGQTAPESERKIILFDAALSRIGGGRMEFVPAGYERYDDGSLRVWFSGEAESGGRDTQKMLVYFRWGVAGEFVQPDYAKYTEEINMWLPDSDEFRVELTKQAGTRYQLIPEGESAEGVLTLMKGSAVITPLRTYLDFYYDRELEMDDLMYRMDFTDADGNSFADESWHMIGGNWEFQRDGNLIYHVTDHILRLDPVPDSLWMVLKTIEGDVVDRAEFRLIPAE